MIRFQQVNKDYGHGHKALKHINFHLNEGEMGFLTGHSGAGKSTLLKLIMAMESPSQGQVTINGMDLKRMTRRKIAGLRQQIGSIFQDAQLIPHRSIYENVALPLIIQGLRYRDIPKRVRPALEMVGLLNKERCYPAALSCGEQQRVGIARAIVTKPKLLLADEPTGNLDPKLSMDIMRLFEKFNQVGVTVLVATHDLALITTMQHRIFTLRHGQMTDDHHHD
jgi:cell division transport system ATP-binding protein